MGHFGIITTTPELKNRYGYIPDIIYHKIPETILNVICLKFKKIEYQDIRIPDTDIKITIAQLPITEKQLDTIQSESLEKKCKTIFSFFEKQKVEEIFISKHLKVYERLLERAHECKKAYNQQERLLLMAISFDVVKKICKILGIDLFETHVKIFEYSYSWKSRLLIEMMSSYTKYITLVTQQTKEAERHMDELYDESGLTVHVSAESHKTDDVEIIYILDDLDRYVKMNRFNPNSILFVFSPSNMSGYRMNNIIIDSVDIKLPDQIEQLIKPLGLSDHEELVECSILGKIDNTLTSRDIAYYKQIRRVFYQMGYQINALKACGKPVSMERFETIAKNLKRIK
ncbi:hypothetical protein [Petroclostridium sp. X23]|uniref:hypothetical protein n=1 Tax=Petroclostridium sp. X23 TaxID=3045146 RepID=UPI0024AD43E2|nr:hypothetical protein [Petroclostridium sp. X23]WHH56868.1 hypothetical protein QKW49_13505 [Petroclostridium sp. X23]